MTLAVTQSGAAQTAVSDTGASDSLNYNSFPGLCRMPNGNLLLAYHAGNDHTGSTTCKIKVKIGTNNGDGTYTWGSEATLATGSVANLCDVGCITLANGDVMVTWNDSSTPGHATINTVVNFRYRKSSDNGATWATTVSQAVPGWATTVTAGAGGGAYALAPCKPVQHSGTGDLYIATYGWDNRAIEDGGGSFSSREYVKLCKSTDMGATWSIVSTIFPDTVGTAYDETDLIFLDDGTLIAACRQITGTGTGYNTITRRSTDNGATWGTATIVLGTSSSTGYGGRPDLAQTANGGVLLRFRYMSAGQSSWTGYRLSTDRGVSWAPPDIDPYDGVTGKTGMYTGAGRGPDVYGAFALTAAGSNVVAYAWSEETNPGTGTRSIIYFRTLTVTGNLTAEGYGNTVSAGYGEATVESGAGSLLVLPESSAWEQVGTSIFVRTVNEPSTVEATISGTAGGLLRFQGADAARFDASLDGVTWAGGVDVPAGTSTVHLRVTPVTAGSTLAAQVGVPV